MGSNYLTVDGSSTTSSGSSDSLNGLKFGHKIYFGDVGLAVTGKSGGGSSSAADDGGPGGQGAAKKGRGGVVQSGQPPRCQVEGCNVDLSDAKQYYSRHKVCCMHSKSPVVVVGGIEQRFCQQCSRFHQLPEFDQGKRSCRRRLAGHNERRRKPPPGSLLSSRFGRLSSSILDSSSSSSGFIVDFSAYSRASGRNVWPGTEASDHVRGTWPGSSVDPQHDVFLQGTTSGSDFSTDSSCALSLLSNQHWGSSNQPSGVIGSSHLMSVSGAPMAQPGSDHSLVAGHFPPCGTAPGWDHEAEGSSNHLMPDLGHGQVPESHPFRGALEMAHPNAWHYMETGHSRGYNQSTEHGHWSL